MSTCRRRAVLDGALAYAGEQLWLARGLEGALRDVLATGRWDAWTVADPAVPASRLQQFSAGGSLGARAALRRALADAVAGAMAARAPAVWLVPDPLARPDDAVVTRSGADRLALDDAVYYVERTADPDRLMAAWRYAQSAVGQVGLVTTADIGDGVIGPEDLRRAATRARLVVVTAYDGDGELFLEAP